jgi:hypothetical protein
VRVLTPGASAEIEMQWFNWCGTPSEGTAIQPTLQLRFSTGADITIPATAQTMQPPRCDAQSQPSSLNVSAPLTPQ